MYILQILNWLNEPHTYRELVDTFGEEKRDALRTLVKADAVKVVWFVRGHDKMVYQYQATGKPYINQKTRKWYDT